MYLDHPAIFDTPEGEDSRLDREGPMGTFPYLVAPSQVGDFLQKNALDTSSLSLTRRHQQGDDVHQMLLLVAFVYNLSWSSPPPPPAVIVIVMVHLLPVAVASFAQTGDRYTVLDWKWPICKSDLPTSYRRWTACRRVCDCPEIRHDNHDDDNQAHDAHCEQESRKRVELNGGIALRTHPQGDQVMGMPLVV